MTRNQPPPFLPALFLLTALVHPLRAELKWDTQKIDLKPRPTDKMAEAKFGFVNAGKDQLIIESVKSSCGCTVPTLEKTTYAPGERGEVLARFDIGDRKGTQSATIRVTTRGLREPVVLTLTVAIPEAAKLTPAILLWKTGEKAEPKTIDVEAMPGQTLRVTKAASSTPHFDVKVETVEESAKYRLVVTPASTERPAVVLLNIETQITDGTKTLHAYAQVRGDGVAQTLPTAPPAPTAADVELEPAVLVWELNKKPVPKPLTLKASAGHSAKVIKATSSSPTFDAKVETVADSAEYRIIITPHKTAKEELAFVNIESETDTGTTVRRAYVQIAPTPK